MNEIKAQLNYFRMSPRKVRTVARLIHGKNVKDALAQLNFLSKKSSSPIAKLLKSAISNTKNNFKTGDENRLMVKKVTVNGGPTLKRYMPRSRGMANMIKKRTSHISIVLAEQSQNKKLNLKNKKS